MSPAIVIFQEPIPPQILRQVGAHLAKTIAVGWVSNGASHAILGIEIWAADGADR